MPERNRQIAILSFAFLGIIACKEGNNQNVYKNETIPTDTVMIQQSTSEERNIIYDYNAFPIDSIFTTKVLTIGTFHDEEVWDGAEKIDWYGLFEGKDFAYIDKVRIKTNKVYDPIRDETENDKTGWDIETFNEDPAILLIEKQSYLAPRSIQRAILTKDQIFPGDTIRINYLGINYEIFATGGKEKVQNDPEWYDVWNYKLYLKAIVSGQQRQSLLVARPNFDDQMINLIFAGDIDGDRILDLIIDTSRHYNVSSPTIYLSKPANRGEIVKPIGSHVSIGC